MIIELKETTTTEEIEDWDSSPRATNCLEKLRQRDGNGAVASMIR